MCPHLRDTQTSDQASYNWPCIFQSQLITWKTHFCKKFQKWALSFSQQLMNFVSQMCVLGYWQLGPKCCLCMQMLSHSHERPELLASDNIVAHLPHTVALSDSLLAGGSLSCSTGPNGIDSHADIQGKICCSPLWAKIISWAYASGFGLAGEDVTRFRHQFAGKADCGSI